MFPKCVILGDGEDDVSDEGCSFLRREPVGFHLWQRPRTLLKYAKSTIISSFRGNGTRYRLRFNSQSMLPPLPGGYNLIVNVD